MFRVRAPIRVPFTLILIMWIFNKYPKCPRKYWETLCGFPPRNDSLIAVTRSIKSEKVKQHCLDLVVLGYLKNGFGVYGDAGYCLTKAGEKEIKRIRKTWAKGLT